MCPHGEKPKNFPIGDMKWELVKELLYQGAGWFKDKDIPGAILRPNCWFPKRAYSIKMNWRGEPTLYKRLPEAIDLAKELGYVDIMINTNGNYPDELNYHLGNLTTCIFSIDSLKPEIYAKIRKHGDLELVLKNIKKMSTLHPNVKLVAQMRLQELNENEADDFIKYFKQMGIEAKVGPAMQRSEGNYVLGDLIAVGRKNCFMPWRRLLIDWKGNIYPCCCMWDGKYNLGNIKEKTLKEVWDKNTLSFIRRGLKTKIGFNYEPCKSCFSRESYVWKK